MRTGRLIGAALLLSLSLPAMAQVPYWTNGVPLATPPLTGNERVPADTYLSGTTAPQQEGISTAQLKTYIGAGCASGSQFQVLVLGSGGVSCVPDSASLLNAGALELGSSGVPGSVQLGNASTGTVSLQPVTGALGTVTALLPANSGTLAELNLSQTWTAAQIPGAGSSGLLPVYNGTGTLKTGAALKTVVFSQVLSAGAATVILTGASVFVNTPICVGSDQTGTAPVQVVATSTSSVTLAGTGTDVLGVICVGN